MIKDLLRGKIPLFISYWIFGVLALVIYKIIGLIIEHYYLNIMMLSSGKWLIYLYILFPFLYFPLIYFAIWRSANHYTKNKLWPILAKISVVLGAILLLMNGLQILNELIYPKASLKNLEQEIRIINKNLPFKIDSETELMKVSFAGNLISYNYRLYNQDLEKMDVQKFSTNIREKLLPIICGSKELKPYLASGMSVSYDYVDQKGKEIKAIVINPGDCK